MAEQAVAVTRAPGGVRRLVLIMPVLLLVAVVVNWGSIRDIAHGRRTVRSVVYGYRQEHFGGMGTFRFPQPLGPENAKVKVLVVAQEGNPCHLPLVQLWQAIGSLAGDHVRVVFLSRGEAVKKMGGKPLDLGCETGVIINGRTRFDLVRDGRKRTVYFTKPHPSPGMPAAMPAGEPKAGPKATPKGMPAVEMGWSLQDLVEVVNDGINKAYGKGGNLTVGALKAAQAALAAQDEQQGMPSGPVPGPPSSPQPPRP